MVSPDEDRNNTTTVQWPAIEAKLSDRRDQQLSALKQVPHVDAILERISVPRESILPPAALSESSASLSPQEQQLYQMQRHNAFQAFKECSILTRGISECRKAITQLKLEARNAPSPNEELYCQKAIDVVRERMQELLEGFSKIAAQNPEAFNVVHSRPLRRYARQLNRGKIAILPYVEGKIGETIEALQSTRVVVLHGPTGSGKTEVAQVAGRIATGKEPLILAGHRDVSAREFRGHDQLKKSCSIPPSEIPARLEELKEQYRSAYPEAESTAREDAERIIEAKFIRDNAVTESEFVLGYLYKAAKEGKPLIIDEYNLIQQAVLLGQNHILTKRDGELIDVPEDGHPPIVVQKGFCVIMTGNLNTGAGAEYRDRETPDASTTNRAIFIKYGFLPQTTDSGAKDAQCEDKQLYTMMLAQLRSGRPAQLNADLSAALEDRALTVNLPDGAASLDPLWRLAKLAAITQLALEGKATAESSYHHMRHGVAMDAEVEHALTPRVVVHVLEQWKNSGFEYELDHYIFRALVDRAITDYEKDYFYRQMKLQGFCQSAGWPEIIDDGENSRLYSNVIPPMNKRQSEVSPVPGRVILREIFGEAPARKSWPGEALPSEERTELNDAAQLVRDLTEMQDLISDLEGIVADSPWLAIPGGDQ
jgi:MoxR-like ATPase